MDFSKFSSTDIGVNASKLYEVISKYNNSTFVELGVRSGVSSEIFLIDSEKNNNKIYGVDVDWSLLSPYVNSHINYT